MGTSIIWELQVSFGWTLMLAGAVSGAIIGLYFHDAEWAGGYGSFRRRMLRLGHIACFGMGILNVLAALSAKLVGVSGSGGLFMLGGLLIAGLGMPLLCFLTARREAFRHLFFIPVLGVAFGILPLIFGGLL